MNPNDENQVRLLYDTILKTWNDQDAAGLADLFTEDGYIISPDGSCVNGRDGMLAGYFTGNILEIRQLSAMVYVLRAVADSDRLSVIQTMVVQEQGGEFKIVFMTSTKMNLNSL